jgi:hypothetical protein
LSLISKEVKRVSKKHEIVLDSSKLRNETATNGLYQTPVDFHTHEELKKQNPSGNDMMAMGGIVGGFGGIGAALSLATAFSPFEGVHLTSLWIAGWSALSAGLVSGTVGYFVKATKMENKYKRMQSLVTHTNVVGLENWLKKRYSIKVFHETLESLASSVSKTDMKTGLLCRFYDEDGVLYELHNDEYNRRYVTKVDSTPQDYKTPITPVKEDIAVATTTQKYLSEDSNHLVERITTISQKLRNSALTTEQTHELDRIVDETKKVCEIRSGIYALDPEQEESDSVRKTLSSLQGQIKALLRVQIAELEKELTVQHTYVTANDAQNVLEIEKV